MYKKYFVHFRYYTKEYFNIFFVILGIISLAFIPLLSSGFFCNNFCRIYLESYPFPIFISLLFMLSLIQDSAIYVVFSIPPLLYFTLVLLTRRKLRIENSIFLLTMIIFILDGIYFYNNFSDMIKSHGNFIAFRFLLTNLFSFIFILIIFVINKYLSVLRFLFYWIIIISFSSFIFPVYRDLP